ncbi:MAG: hypothetical protein ACRCXD_14970 [Luteolibacter sp.]
MHLFVILSVLLASPRLAASSIAWFSDAAQVNLDGSDVPMDAGFHFELGVFSNGFVPTRQNVGQWATRWVAADSTAYNPNTRRFADLMSVADNRSPFLVGTQAWIFGYRVTPTGTDMILLRNTGWIWPAPDPLNPIPSEWNVANADQVVLGNLNAGGSPFLMQSGRIQFFAQWQTELLTGEPLAGPRDDPDGDGSSNLLEFIFSTPPKIAGPATATPVTFLAGHAHIRIPRRVDRPALLTVEVSGNLADWQSGEVATQIMEDGGAALVVRDLAPLGPLHPRRFMRLKVEPAVP